MQQLFRLLIFLNQSYMFRATDSAILRSAFDCIYSQKCSWGWANLSPEICRAELKRLISEKVFTSYLLLTSWYINGILLHIKAAGSKLNIDVKFFFSIRVQYNGMRCCSFYWNIFLYCVLWTNIL